MMEFHGVQKSASLLEGGGGGDLDSLAKQRVFHYTSRFLEQDVGIVTHANMNPDSLKGQSRFTNRNINCNILTGIKKHRKYSQKVILACLHFHPHTETHLKLPKNSSTYTTLWETVAVENHGALSWCFFDLLQTNSANRFCRFKPGSCAALCLLSPSIGLSQVSPAILLNSCATQSPAVAGNNEGHAFILLINKFNTGCAGSWV